MADYIQKDNSGTIFKNDRKEKESHPNAKGSCVIDGVEYWISAWTKKDRNGNPFQSLAFQKKEQAPVAAPRSAPPRQAPRNDNKPNGGFNDIDSDIPWD